MKRKGYIFLHRKEIDIRSKMWTDGEFRMMMCLATLADWDNKHENFGTFSKTYKKIKEENLPKWSLGKISGVLNKLIKKKLISRLGTSKIRIENFWIYISLPEKVSEFYERIDLQNDQLTELNVQSTEQSVHPTENAVQDSEKIKYAKIKEEIDKIVGKPRDS